MEVAVKDYIVIAAIVAVALVDGRGGFVMEISGLGFTGALPLAISNRDVVFAGVESTAANIPSSLSLLRC